MKVTVGVIALTLGVSASTAGDVIPFDSPRWKIDAEESRIEDYKGKTSLVLRGGLALIDDAIVGDPPLLGEGQDGIRSFSRRIG